MHNEAAYYEHKCHIYGHDFGSIYSDRQCIYCGADETSDG